MTKPAKSTKPKGKNWLEKLNEHYALVLEGGDVRIFTKEHDANLNHNRVVTIKPPAFKTLYDNQLIDLSLTDDKKPKLVGKGSAWIKHAARRTYPNGTTLMSKGNAPVGCYNLWSGFGVEPVAGNWSCMRWHLLQIVCRGDRKSVV